MSPLDLRKFFVKPFSDIVQGLKKLNQDYTMNIPTEPDPLLNFLIT